MIFTPIYTHAQPIKLKGWVSIQTQQSFGGITKLNPFKDDSFGLQATNSFNNLKTNLTVTVPNKKHLFFDQSFIEFDNKDYKIGFGKLNRNWSFSNQTSLILSDNARPSTSIYFLNNDSESNRILSSWIGPWSFEAFNSILSPTDKSKNSMLLGIRLVMEPYNNLKFELVKTSQWGGTGNSKSLSAFSSAIIGNTNESNNSNINQMAGFGSSFEYNINQLPIRTYTQIIGEDESGSLPSCLISLIGSELSLKNKLFSEIGFEYIDTRVDTSEHGFCGPQTAYNNIDYSYTNYGKSMGAPIDSESKLFNIWASTNISENTSISYSIKNFTINDFNSINHRLSSTKENGWVTSIGASWKFNSLNINGILTYQDLKLDKAKYNEGFSLNLNTHYSF